MTTGKQKKRNDETSVEDARREIESLYTPLAEAAEELRRRRSDQTLRRVVGEFQRDHPPQFLSNEPVAIITRNIQSGDYELERFLSLVSGTGLHPCLCEIADDRFTSLNVDKYRRGKLTFYLGGKERALRVMDFDCEGRAMRDIRSLGELGLVEYHRQILARMRPAVVNNVRDISEWFLAVGRKPPFYLHYLTLGIVDGMIFENFLPHDPEERRFFYDRVLPSFEKAVEHFGLRPLIVRMFSTEEENNPKMWQYPGELYQYAIQLLKKPKTGPVSNGEHGRDRLKAEKGPSRIQGESYSWQNPKTEVRHTNRYGKGVFAKKSIASGEILFVMAGPILTQREEQTLPEGLFDKPIEISERFSISPRTMEDLDRMPQHYVNHSCDPNAGFAGQIFLVAMREILKGEEIVYDYAMCLRANSETEFTMDCACGTEKCRGVILGGDWQIPELQVRYAGYFQLYLNERIKARRQRETLAV